MEELTISACVIVFATSGQTVTGILTKSLPGNERYFRGVFGEISGQWHEAAIPITRCEDGGCCNGDGAALELGRGSYGSRVADIVATTIGIDTHNHIDVPLTAAEMPGPDIDLAGEMKRSGLVRHLHDLCDRLPGRRRLRSLSQRACSQWIGSWNAMA